MRKDLDLFERIEQVKELQKSERYKKNLGAVLALVDSNFCARGFFWENLLSAFGMEKATQKIYACESQKDVENLVYSLI